MWYQAFIPAPVFMIPILVMTAKGIHMSKNDSNIPSDVIVTYSNHAEASHDDRILETPVLPETTISIPSSTKATPLLVMNKSVEHINNARRPKIPRKENIEEERQDDVLFIPNDRGDSKVRNEYYLQNDRASISEIMGGHKTLEDLLAKKDVRLETEPPVSDIIFVMGKNSDQKDNGDKNIEEKRWKDDRSRQVVTASPKLNCSNINCNNAIKSACGEKTDDNHHQRFRLFLNDCYFRKVNCNFKNPGNRFRKVPLDRCKNVGAHSETPFSFSIKPAAPKLDEKILQINNTRRTTSSRRSMTMNIHGQFCSHPCPVSCPELYKPECAVSSTGRHRVFVNHCALDHNSCSFSIVWHSVPLSECVGGKKAELRQNAGFIGWMQRVGIVDYKGRLVYDVQP